MNNFRKQNFSEIEKRIKEEFNVKKSKEIVEIIGTSQPTYSRRKKENNFDIEWAFILGAKKNLSAEWILTGNEPKYLSSMNEENNKNEQKEPGDPEHPERKGKWVECYWHDTKVKTVQIREGAVYIVDPINPQRKKYRGERVKLIHYGKWGNCEILRLDSEWHVKRRHYVEIDICDLKLEKEDEKNG